MHPLFDKITNQIIELLEQGVVPWRITWRLKGCYPPTNYVTKKPYRGINVFLIHLELLKRKVQYSSKYFLTKKQAESLKGCKVREGEEGFPLMLIKYYKRAPEESADPMDNVLMRQFVVFNIEQCEGIKGQDPIPMQAFNPIMAAQQIIADMPNPPVLFHGNYSPCYTPPNDTVKLPRHELFESPEDYYDTAFHELLHSTGHESRLGRPSVTKANHFASEDYSKEELVAEIGAAFLCAMTGIERATIKNNAAYIQSWLENLKNDKTLIFHASAQAQKGVDYIKGGPDILSEDDHYERTQRATWR
ncbi:MAG: zincin-like metallopeptidase domain-containing protein [Thermodesulfovibrionales bacterium]|jgi:antirestriction protein ArdC